MERLISYDDKYNVEIAHEDQKRIAAAPEIGVSSTAMHSLTGSLTESSRASRHDFDPPGRPALQRGPRRDHPESTPGPRRPREEE
jgi:hypothetical protein